MRICKCAQTERQPWLRTHRGVQLQRQAFWRCSGSVPHAAVGMALQQLSPARQQHKTADAPATAGRRAALQALERQPQALRHWIAFM